MSRLAAACAAAAACYAAGSACEAFMLPGSVARPPARLTAASGSAAADAAEAAGWGLAAAGIALGAHAGLAMAWRSKTTRAAEGKYVESVSDQRLFESVYQQYTSEYLKGPLYWHPMKRQGFLPDYPGEPMVRNNRLTSNVVGNLKAFSSNELAFLSMLFFGIGLYGNLQFLFYDPQWAKVDAGGYFNVSYIVESLLLPISFFMHIAAYIQKQNGK
eukprot:TRINITY_DN5652_c0_g1_i1.p1 TRINITY_DN5652_c0_g1~~TRINITY_DN5652_c0_g1_i1.p1  ORF type:complete len:216 (+),score=66.13 TRINITY_DN5652_c0_g1_i1:50-697(+)